MYSTPLAAARAALPALALDERERLLTDPPLAGLPQCAVWTRRLRRFIAPPGVLDRHAHRRPPGIRGMLSAANRRRTDDATQARF